MTGDRDLWTLRRAQHRPEAAWVVDGESPHAGSWRQNPHCITGQFQPEISIAEQDIPEVLDLRFLVGMTVHVCGLRGRSRAHRLHDAIVAANAAKVVTSIHESGQIELITHGV